MLVWLEIRKFAPSPPSDLANFRIATLACTGDEQIPQPRVMFRRRLGAEEQAEGLPRLADQHGQPVDCAQPAARAACRNGVSSG